MQKLNASTIQSGIDVAMPPVGPLASPLPEPKTKLLLVDFRNGEAVHQHPDVAPYLKQGWLIRSAVPRIVEGKGTRLLVVLSQGTRGPLLTRIK